MRWNLRDSTEYETGTLTIIVIDFKSAHPGLSGQ